MNNKQIFVLASRLNGEELIANIGVQTGFVPVAAFYSLENAKDLYWMAYKIMQAGSMQITQVFALEYQRPAFHRPAILKMTASEGIQIIT